MTNKQPRRSAGWWDTCSDPIEMLDYLDHKISDRKFRLFSCSACRLGWAELGKPASRDAIEQAERFADSLITAEALELACSRAEDVSSEDNPLAMAAVYAAEQVAWGGAIEVVYQLQDTFGATTLAELLREIVGNPMRSVALKLRATSRHLADMRQLAQQIYNERSFSLLPLLGDSLVDAGCSDALVLSHCQRQGGHARGCWVVDLCLQAIPPD